MSNRNTQTNKVFFDLRINEVLVHVGFVCEFWGEGKERLKRGREGKGGKGERREKPSPCLRVEKPTRKGDGGLML